jgi:hypothetical protein
MPHRSPSRVSPLRGLSAFVRLVPMGALALLLSCSSDDPVMPPAHSQDALTETAAAKKGGKPKLDDGALSIEDMLGDPLFQVLVLGIDEPSLADPLLAAVDALALEQMAKGTNLLKTARAAADALEDEPIGEALILWSAVERYCEAAELL